MVDLYFVDPAPAGRRLLGAVIDAVPAVALVVAAIVWSDPLVRWILLGCLLAYLILLWAWAAHDGRGPGKWLTGLRVIDARTGRRPGAWPALVRLAARGVIGVGTLGIAGLSYRWDPEGLEQTWWDRVAGSRVVAAGSAVGDGRTSTGGRGFGGASGDQAGVRGFGADDPVARARWTPEPAGRPDSSGPPVAPPGVVAGPRPPEVVGPGPLGPPMPLGSPVVPGPVSEPSRPEPARAGRYTPVTLAPTAPTAGSTGQAEPGVVEAPTVRVPPPGRTGRSRGTPAGPAQAAGSPDLPMIRNVPLPVAAGSVGGPPDGGPVGEIGERTVSMRARTVTLAWDSGRTVVVTGRVLVGREPEPEPGEIVERTLPVETDSRGVSKTHLSIDVGPAGVTVTDRHSTNGVRLVRADGIGARVPAGEPVDVWVGDRLEFGGRSLRIAEIGP